MIFKTIILDGKKYELTKYNFNIGNRSYWVDNNGIVTDEIILNKLNNWKKYND